MRCLGSAVEWSCWCILPDVVVVVFEKHVVHAADIQDRDGGALVMATMFGMYPFLLKLYADGGYQGPVFRRAVTKIMTQGDLE
jgi:hypothetical protein